MELLYIASPEQIAGYTDQVWEICQRAYKPIGGFLSIRNKKDIPKRVNLIKIVPSVDSDGNPIVGACALYRAVPGDFGSDKTGYKGIGYAGNKGIADDYRECLELIIKDDIASYTGWYWVEASGAIEHYFAKHGGLIMPNVYVNRMLNRNIPDSDMSDDGIHYSITLGIDGTETFQKCLVGFPNKESYDAIMQLYGSIDAFSQAAKDVLDGVKTADDLPKLESEEPLPKDKIRGAVWYIFHLDECCYNNDINEVPPQWIELLNRSMSLLTQYYDRIKTASIDNIIATGHELQCRLAPLVLHRITETSVPHRTI